ncbi:MATE family efflux transporter [Pontibacter diazotrophicus]|nr:hypothetical protein [Pontibacter diazotrophicus]
MLVPLLLKGLGAEKYGVWQTALSVISLGSLLNFGLGNGLRNLITQLIIKGESDHISIAVWATVKTMSKIVLVALFLIIPLFLLYFSPSMLFANNSITGSEVTNSITIFIFFFLINLVLGLSNSIALGFNKSYLTGFVQALYIAGCYLALLIFNRFQMLNLISVAIIFGGFQSILYLIFFFYQTCLFKINVKFKGSYSLSETYNLSGKFFLVQVLSLLYLLIDNFVISRSLGAETTGEYSIVNRVFFTLINVFSILLIQFWSSVTEAQERKETLWITKALKLLFLASIGVFIVSLIVSYFKDWLLGLWLEDNYTVITSLTFYLFAVYTLTHCINAIFINLQNGLGELKLQIFSTLIALIIYIIGCFALDISKVGYNYLIVLKIVGTLAAILINSFILKKVLHK